MMGVKRNLLPEFSASTVSEVFVMATRGTRSGGKPGPNHRKRKRNATTATKVVVGDSLGIVLVQKENVLTVKTRKAIRQRKENNSQTFEPSVLMDLDLKENTNSSNKGITKAKTEPTRQQKVNSSKNCASKSTKNRRIATNNTGSVLVCFDTDNEAGSSSRIREKMNRSKPKRGQQNKKNNTISRKIRVENAVSNGDSLMACLAESSKTLTESIRVGTELNQKQTKPRIQRKKKSEKCATKDRSNVVKSAEVSDQGEKSLTHPKRSTVASCNVGGLGAFVGIVGEGTHPRKAKKKLSNRRLISPLEGDLMTNSLRNSNAKGNSSKQKIDRKTRKVEFDPSTLGEVPSVIIISLPKQTEELKQRMSLETISTIETQSKIEHEPQEPTKDENLTESSEIERRRPQRSTGKLRSTRTELNKINPGPPISISIEEKKVFDQKFSIGTKFQKDFDSHGWFSGEIVSFEPETGYYKVCYEDGDTEELEQYELEQCTFKLDGSAGTRPDGELQRRSNSIVTEEEDNSQKDSVKNRSRSTASRKNDQCRSIPVEKVAPLRRSRRKSKEPTKAPDPKQSNVTIRQKTEAKRRSKRRKSQPVRFIDSVASDQKQVPRSTGSKKSKRCSKMPEIETKQSSTSKLSTSMIGNVKENTINDNPPIPTIQNRPSSPSTDDNDNRNKQRFDDALKAVMPIEDNTLRSTCDLGKLEDDIFNSTPMRNLFARRLSNADETDTTNQHEEENNIVKRRSRRKSVEPERFGYSAESATKSSKKIVKSDSETKSSKKNTTSVSEAKSSKKKTKSAMKRSKRKTKGGLAAKKRVRISIEPPGVTTFDSNGESKESDPWTKADLRALHRAHRLVDPRSFSFWEDVSEIFGDRSALECRQKWFSLAKTPEPKKPKPKKKGSQNTNTMSNYRNLDDDIFNSTPMRSAFGIGENIDLSSNAFEEIGEISKINVGSAIKISRPDQNDENQPSNIDQTSCPHGYKTYLQKMGRIMRQKDTRKRRTDDRTKQPPFPIGKKLAERIEEGDVEVKGRLSPGGTLRVDTFGDTDTEDYLDYEDEAE